MEVDAAKTFVGWEPVGDKSKSYHSKFKLGDIYKIKISHCQDQRSAKFNSKYWVMLGEVVKNTDRYHLDEQLHHDVKWCLGITKLVKNEITGEIKTEVGSTDFQKMGELMFEKFYQAAITLIVKEILTGVTKQELMDRVNHILRFS